MYTLKNTKKMNTPIPIIWLNCPLVLETFVCLFLISTPRLPPRAHHFPEFLSYLFYFCRV